MGQEFSLANALLLFFLWLPQATIQILCWIYWIQVKEYRWDRFQVLVRSPEGRQALGFYWLAVKFLGLVSSLLFPYIQLVLAVLLLSNFWAVKKIFVGEVRRPVFTLRANELLLTSFVFPTILVLVFYNFIPSFAFLLILAEAGILLGPFLGIVWTSPLVLLTKMKAVKQAQRHLSKIKPTVIGITGSYGKSTTKEFVAHLLSQKYKTAKTTGSENTELGIARKTTSSVSEDTKFFVVEMGAYKRGEIKRLTEIVHPSVGIITGIEPQHLALFGSLENIKKAKYELIESLPKDGIAVFNYSNKICQKLAEKARKQGLKVYGYQLLRKQEKSLADLVAKVIKADVNGIEFSVFFQGRAKRVFAPVHGMHFVENLAGAILISRLFKVGWQQIVKGCKNISTLDRTMSLYKIRSDILIIDDSYNSTPSSFAAALDYLALFKGRKKIVITPGIIELGKMSSKVHRQLGRTMDYVADRIILTSSDFLFDIKSSVKDGSKLVLANKASVLQDELRHLLNEKKAVVLLEGRMPSVVYSVLKKL